MTIDNRLKAINPDETKASEGKFRAVVCIDSDMFQVGENHNTLEDAKKAILPNPKLVSCPISVTNDKGKHLWPPA